MHGLDDCIMLVCVFHLVGSYIWVHYILLPNLSLIGTLPTEIYYRTNKHTHCRGSSSKMGLSKEREIPTSRCRLWGTISLSLSFSPTPSVKHTHAHTRKHIHTNKRMHALLYMHIMSTHTLTNTHAFIYSHTIHYDVGTETMTSDTILIQMKLLNLHVFVLLSRITLFSSDFSLDCLLL